MEKSAAYLMGLKHGLELDLPLEKVAQVVDIIDYLESASPHQKQAMFKALTKAPALLQAIMKALKSPTQRLPLFRGGVPLGGWMGGPGRGGPNPSIYRSAVGRKFRSIQPRAYTTRGMETQLRRARPSGAFQNWWARMSGQIPM